jgi:PHP family Zn ribbon phosphoesterase
MGKVKDKSNNLSKYFKGIDLKGRVSVLETAKTLLEVQKENDALLADAPAPPNEAEKEGLA